MTNDFTEYYTTSTDEYNYLRSYGVYYTHTFHDSNTDSITYCYKKTYNLFRLLASYYYESESNQSFNSLKELFEKTDANVFYCNSETEAMDAIKQIMREQSGAAQIEPGDNT